MIVRAAMVLLAVNAGLVRKYGEETPPSPMRAPL